MHEATIPAGPGVSVLLVFGVRKELRNPAAPIGMFTRLGLRRDLLRKCNENACK